MLQGIGNCHKKNNSELHEMCYQKRKNWNNLPINLKRGSGIIKTSANYDENGKVQSRSKWEVDKKIPIFTKERNYINELQKS